MISNQGRVFWDSTEDGNNNAIELTDDPTKDDGIDQDNDGDTDDDDPTIRWVLSFQSPEYLTESFSDDIAGKQANHTFFDLYTWFETDLSARKSVFSVAESYHYATPRSFKTQLRSTDTALEWRYNLTVFEKDIAWWEIWFRCGNSSASGDLYLTFKDKDDSLIAQLRFEYITKGSDPLTPYMPKLHFLSSTNKWWPLSTEYIGGYLYDGWYKVRIEQNGSNNIDYTLSQAGKNIIDYQHSICFSSPLTRLHSIEWSSTQDSAVAPMLFWDEHRIGLI